MEQLEAGGASLWKWDFNRDLQKGKSITFKLSFSWVNMVKAVTELNKKKKNPRRCGGQTFQSK